MNTTTERSGRATGWLPRLACDVRVQVLLGLAAIALAVAVGVGLGRRSVPRPKPPAAPMAMPEANPIADAWTAAAAGDVAAYLACFASEARAGLDARLAKTGREGFRAELRAEAEAALGIEWGPPQRTPDGALSFPVTVEHKDDAERFDYEVVRVGSDWKIRAIVPRGHRPVSPPYAERLGPHPEQGDKK